MNNSNIMSHDDIFIEKHNGFLKENGKPDDEYWEAKEGRYQYRITSVHYKSEKEARDKLQQILDNQEIRNHTNSCEICRYQGTRNCGKFDTLMGKD